MVCLRTVRSVLAVVVGLLAVGATTALAAGEPITKTVAAEIVVKKGNKPGQQGQCSAVAFAQWKKVPGTQSARVSYVFAGSASSKSGAPPFDNDFKIVIPYKAPGGSDWINLGKSWLLGNAPNNCSKQATYMNDNFVKGALVELTIVCDAKRTTQSRAGTQAGVENACPAPDCANATAETTAMLHTVRDIAADARQPASVREGATSAAESLRFALTRQRQAKRDGLLCTRKLVSDECAAVMRQQAKAFEALNQMAGALKQLALKQPATAEKLVSEGARLMRSIDEHQSLATRAASLCR